MAYVWDATGDFRQRVNRNHGLTELEPVCDAGDAAELRTLIEKHKRYTRSDRASAILENWEAELPRFVKVVSVEYRRAQAEMAAEALAA